MKKIPLLLLLTVFFLSLCGCEIKFTAFTKINEDGSGFRIATYSASGTTEKEELISRYKLPEGGGWKTEQLTGPSYNVTTYIYESKKSFKDLKELAPDYVRRGVMPENVSSNRFSLKVNNGLIFTTYEYEEIFRDSADEKKVKEFCERQYNYILDLVSKDIAADLPKLAEKEKVKAALNDRYRPYFDYFVKGFLKNPAFFKDDKGYEVKNKQLEELNTEENFTSFIADFILSQNKNADKKVVLNKLRETYKKIDEKLQLHMEVLSEKNFNDNFGVYGLSLITNYPFSVSVMLPGKITDSNSKDIRKNTAKWVFTSSDFFLKEYKLQAKSRKLNYAAVGIFVLAALIVLILLNLRHVRKIRK